MTRTSGVVITESLEFSALWPRLFARVVATLRQRGVDWASAEDAVQEAGARALARQVPYTSEDDLRRWVQTVAWRVAVDNHRRTNRWRSPRVGGGRVPAGASLSAATAAPTAAADAAASNAAVSATDVANEVEARIELRAVERMFPLLSAADRAALLDDTPAGQTRKEAVRAAVRRHRARARLVALVEGLASALGFLPLRRLASWRAALVPSVAAAVLVPMALLHSPLGAGSSSAEGQGAAGGRTHIVLRMAAQHTPEPALAPSDGEGGGSTRTSEPAEGGNGGHRPPAAAPASSDGGGVGGFSVRAPIPGPPGEADQGDAGVRPKDPGKPLLCVSAPTAGRVCTPERSLQDSLPATGS